MKLYFDKAGNVVLNENKLRAYLLQHESEDLYNNSDNYINGRFDLDMQLDIIKRTKYGKIEAVINILNASWGYQIDELNIPNDLSVYMSVGIMQEFVLYRKHVIIDRFNALIEHLIYLYYTGEYHTKNTSMLDSVNEFIDDHKSYINNKLESDDIIKIRKK